MQFLHRTFNSEGNPLFGKHPSDVRLWGEGTAIILVEIGFAWWVYFKKKWLGWIFITIFLLQAAWQLHLYFENVSSYEHIHHFWR
jgi:hypothetical protein